MPTKIHKVKGDYNRDKEKEDLRRELSNVEQDTQLD